jgi:hypothetical protein
LSNKAAFSASVDAGGGAAQIEAAAIVAKMLAVHDLRRKLRIRIDPPTGVTLTISNIRKLAKRCNEKPDLCFEIGSTSLLSDPNLVSSSFSTDLVASGG